MKIFKELISNIKENINNISSRNLLLFIIGVLATELVFDIISINAILHYGVAIASFVIVSFLSAIIVQFNIKDTLKICFGSLIALCLIVFAII